MTKSPRPYFLLIQRALTQIDQYLPTNKSEFMTQQMAQDAILMRLQVIGENLARIRRLDDDAFSGMAPNSWHKLIGLRNIISHAYDVIDYEEIWQIVTDELPGFASSIDAAIARMPE